MYGVSGYSEPCYEQEITNINIDRQQLDTFLIQLGITKESYGFDGTLGIDCKYMKVRY